MLGGIAPRSWVSRTLLLLILTLAVGALAQEERIPTAPTRWVTDKAQFISEATRRSLDSKLEAYQHQTGHQVVVYIGASIGSADLAEFANRTFEAWKIGRKGEDDGILMLVLAQDRKIDIEVGYGLEGPVPDAIASRIINEVMVPKLRAGDPDGAISSGVDAVLAAIEGKSFDGGQQGAPGPGEAPSKGSSLFGLILMGLFLLLFITNPRMALMMLFMMGGRGGRGGGFGGGGGGFSGGGGMSGGGGARGSW